MPRRPHSAYPLALLALGWALTSPPALAADAAPDSPQLPTPNSQLPTPVLHALGLMTAMRLSEAYLWPHPFAEVNRATLMLHYHEAFTLPPRWDGTLAPFEEDGDRWQINVLGHGLFGSELYLRARTCRLPAWQALLFTTAVDMRAQLAGVAGGGST